MKAWSFAYFAPGEEKSEGLGPLFGTGTYNMTNANALFGDFMIWRGITDFHCYVLREGTICLFCLWPSAIRREWGKQSQIYRIQKSSWHSLIGLRLAPATLAWCLLLPATMGGPDSLFRPSGGYQPEAIAWIEEHPVFETFVPNAIPGDKYEDSWLAHAAELGCCCLTNWPFMTPKEVEAFCLSSSSPCFSAPRLHFAFAICITCFLSCSFRQLFGCFEFELRLPTVTILGHIQRCTLQRSALTDDSFGISFKHSIAAVHSVDELQVQNWVFFLATVDERNQ